MSSFLNRFFLLSSLAATSMNATPGVTAAQANGIALQSDGSIVTAGTIVLNGIEECMTARFIGLGLVDITYGNFGYAAVPIGSAAVGNGLSLLSSNKALIVGSAQTAQGTSFSLAQLTTAGALDATFNVTGKQTTFVGQGCSGNAIAIQSNGDVVVAGVAIFSGIPTLTLARYTPAGVLDTTFGSGGIVTTSLNESSNAFAIALQPNGQILAGGFSVVSGNANFAIARYNSANGSLDTSFNPTGSLPGTVVTPIGSYSAALALAVQSDGKIIAAGRANNGFALARYTSSGLLDTTFGYEGIVETAIGSMSQINALTLQSNGQIVAVGFSDDDLAIARYNTNGSLDTTFNSSGAIPGVVLTSIGTADGANAVAMQGSQILVAGFSDDSSLVARYNSNGSADITFGASLTGYVLFPNSSGLLGL